MTLMKIFILLRRGTPVLFPRDFMAREQPLLEIKNLRVRHELLWYEDFIRLELCLTCKITLAKRIQSRPLKNWCFRVMPETLAFWALGSQCDCFSCFWKSPMCTGLLSWTCSWVQSCVQWLVRLYTALVTFPLRTSILAWCGLRQFYLYPNLGALKAYMF